MKREEKQMSTLTIEAKVEKKKCFLEKGNVSPRGQPFMVLSATAHEMRSIRLSTLTVEAPPRDRGHSRGSQTLDAECRGEFEKEMMKMKLRMKKRKNN